MNWQSALQTFARYPLYSLREAADRRAVAWLWKTGRSYPYLSELTLLPTFRCNMRCSMCPEWGEQGLFRGKERELAGAELPPSAWEEVLSQAASLRPNLIVFGGGELFLYRDWERLARQAKRIGHTMLITNGTFLEANAVAVARWFDFVHVSVDGPEAVHDQIRGEGAYRKAMQGIAALAGKRRRGRPLIKIACTLVPGRMQGLKTWVRELESLVVDQVILQHLMFVTPDQLAALEAFAGKIPFDRHFWAGYHLTLEGEDDLVAQVEAMNGHRPGRVVFHPELTGGELARFYRGGEGVPRGYHRFCLAPWMQVVVLADGDVWLCPGHAVGNVSKTPLSRILRSEEAGRLRRAVREHFPLPVCRSCCYLYSYGG